MSYLRGRGPHIGAFGMYCRISTVNHPMAALWTRQMAARKTPDQQHQQLLKEMTLPLCLILSLPGWGTWSCYLQAALTPISGQGNQRRLQEPQSPPPLAINLQAPRCRKSACHSMEYISLQTLQPKFCFLAR